MGNFRQIKFLLALLRIYGGYKRSKCKRTLEPPSKQMTKTPRALASQAWLSRSFETKSETSFSLNVSWVGKG